MHGMLVAALLISQSCCWRSYLVENLQAELELQMKLPTKCTKAAAPKGMEEVAASAVWDLHHAFFGIPQPQTL